MKLHKPLVEAVIDCLKQIMTDHKYSDKILEKTFKAHPQWGSRDRKFIAESVYDITRSFRYLSFIAETEKNYRMILAAYFFEKGISFPEWPDFQTISTKPFELKKKAIDSPAILHSYPDELWQIGENELGKEKWLKEAQALNEQAPVVLRVNTIKIKKAELIKKLAEAEIEVDELRVFADALQLRKRQNIFTTSFFKDGLFEIQDAGSQLIAPFLNAEPGQKVIDACAGAGGKTLHLAAIMQNKGKILALDVEEWKLDNLRKRAKRAGVSNIEARLITGEKTISQLRNSADRLLLDVPCTGTGVIKRNPDAKWKLSKEVIEKTKQLQYTILKNYSAMVKPGGFLVYATCSVLPSENELQVQKFIAEQGDIFEFIKDKTIYPSEGYDGFYMALIKKK
ncbi:MAG TPA: RsmB/NOP family class I SAM-dependent RNA methyltransferase [Bacteroidia bacterium]|jgi:16S rRNA (cytosine967-C5)-methyltransferase|nr:RsmB/NOP family class I SAM-dependent RNA methyltransferase [Bacteroidia bacterium]